MVEARVIYEGQLHCNATHGPSGAVIQTDAPKDNNGKGEAFSPTDLVGAALASCMLTVMGIYAQRQNLELKGATARVLKEMVTAPERRIGKLTVELHLPRSVPAEQRAALEKAAISCPVYKSLHPDVQKAVTFNYV